MQPSESRGAQPSVAGVLAVWLGRAPHLFGALVCAELRRRSPTGGLYVSHARHSRRALGFLWGWAMFWSMHSGIIAAIAVVFARYAGFRRPLGDTGIRASRSASSSRLSAVNYVGVRAGSRLQTAVHAANARIAGSWSSLGGSLARRVAEQVVVGPPAGDHAGRFPAARWWPGLFAFGGWHMVTYTAGETVIPRARFPRALAIGTRSSRVCTSR